MLLPLGGRFVSNVMLTPPEFKQQYDTGAANCGAMFVSIVLPTPTFTGWHAIKTGYIPKAINIYVNAR